MLGHTYRYYSSDPKEAWLIDSTIDSVDDEYRELFSLHFEKDESTRKDKLIVFLTERLPRWLKVMNKRLVGKKYICGDRITISDFMVAAFLNSICLN